MDGVTSLLYLMRKAEHTKSKGIGPRNGQRTGKRGGRKVKKKATRNVKCKGLQWNLKRGNLSGARKWERRLEGGKRKSRFTRSRRKSQLR